MTVRKFCLIIANPDNFHHCYDCAALAADFLRMYVGSIVRQSGLADILATTNSMAQVIQ